MTEKVKADKARVLTAKELLSGGEDPFHAVELPMIRAGGQPGIVLLRMPTAAEVFALETEDDREKRQESVMSLLAKVMVDANGAPIFGENAKASDLDAMPIIAVNKLVREMTSLYNLDGEGNPSGGEAGSSSESPTN